MYTDEKRIAALEYAVQRLLEGKATSLRYVDGVLCERKLYTTKYTPVDLVDTEPIKRNKG